MKKYREFLEDIINAVIKAVRLGGYTNVYISNTLDIIANNASKDVIEAGGTDIVYTIECMSYGDLGYEKETDFIVPDAEEYIETFQEKLQKVYIEVYSQQKIDSILGEAEAAFETNKKILGRSKSSSDSSYHNLETYLHCIKEKINSMLNNIVDIEEFENLNFNKVLARGL